MKDMKTLEVNGVVLDITDDGAIRFDETQTLTDEQKTQAKENIGVRETLIVTIGEDGTASHNAAEICAHVHSGGTAVCKVGEKVFYNFAYTDGDYVTFSFVEDDNHIYGVKVLADGSCEPIESNIADGISAVSSWNDLTDKPFGEEANTEFLLEETTYEGFTADDTLGVYAMGSSAELTLVAGQNYRVIWDGNAHICTAYGFGMNGYNWVGLGNEGILTGATTEPVEPFVVAYSEEVTNLTLAALDGSAETSHTVAICQDTTVIKTLDSRYLPMDAIDARINEALGVIENGAY